MLRCGIFSEDQIQTNLNLGRAIPFIDDTIVIEDVPTYEKEFGPLDEKWEDFCNKNREAFIKKINSSLFTKS